jgi:hypothetical protein
MRRILALILIYACAAAVQAGDERIFVNAKINGKPIRFAFDTGTGCPFILFSTAAQKLNLKVTPSADAKIGPGGTSLGVTDFQRLDLGFTNIETRFGVVEIPAYLKAGEDGALGWPAISNNIFSIDCDAHEVNFSQNLPNKLAGWTKFHIQTIAGDLTLELTNGKKLEKIVALDSGTPYGVMLNSQKWHGWELVHTNRPMTLEAYYTPTPGLVVAKEGWADKVSLGALTLTDVPVMEADSGSVALFSSPKTQYEATLGLAAMKRLDIIVDGIHGFAYVRPKKTRPLPYDHNRLGAVFVPRNSQNDDLIAHVASGSPAYRAGIRNGDILLKEDGRDVTKWRTDTNEPPKIRPVEQPAGTKLELTLKRGDTIFKTTATLRNILPPDPVPNSN